MKNGVLEERVSFKDELEGYTINHAATPSRELLHGPDWFEVPFYVQRGNYEADFFRKSIPMNEMEKQLKNILQEIVDRHFIRQGLDAVRKIEKDFPHIIPLVIIKAEQIGQPFVSETQPIFLQFYSDSTKDRIHVAYVLYSGGLSRKNIYDFDWMEQILNFSLEKRR